MQLTFSARHIGYIANYITDMELWYKVKSSFKKDETPEAITVEGLTAQDVIGVYNQISGQRHGLAKAINDEIKQALLPQVLNAQGQPKDNDCAALVAWLQQYEASNADELQRMIDNGLSKLSA